jgi:ATP-dependent helicase/DNAse subunit B
MGEETVLTLSKSKLNSYIQCPEKYRISYDLEIRPLKADPALVEGSCLHHLVESALLYQKHLELESILTLASERFWESAPIETCDYLTVENYYLAQRQCLEEARQFLTQVGELECISMEQHIAVPLIDPITMEQVPDINLQGYVDLIDRVADRERIIDIKTSSRKPKEGMAAIALELTLYAYLNTFNEFADSPVAYLNLIRTKEPKVSWDESQRTVDEYVELVGICKNLAANILERRFWRNPGTHCSWCDYQSLCYRDYDLAKEKFGQLSLDCYLMAKDGNFNVMNKEMNYATCAQ